MATAHYVEVVEQDRTAVDVVLLTTRLVAGLVMIPHGAQHLLAEIFDARGVGEAKLDAGNALAHAHELLRRRHLEVRETCIELVHARAKRAGDTKLHTARRIAARRCCARRSPLA